MPGIHHRHTTTLPDDPTADISSDEWNDALVVRANSGESDTSKLGDVLIRAPAAPDGWSLVPGGAGVLASSGAGVAPTFSTAYAPLASPALTGTPTAPTAAPGTNTTQVASTAFVQGEKVSPAFTGTPTAPTAPAATNTTQLATTAFVESELTRTGAAYAPLASPAFTGTPTAPTAPVGTNSTQLATTAFVQAGSVTVPNAVTLTDGATVSLDVSQRAAIYRLAAAGDRTLNLIGTAFSGQKVVIQHFASGGAGRTLTLGSMFRFGSDITGLTQTPNAKTDYIGAIYNGTDNRWDVVAVTKGF